MESAVAFRSLNGARQPVIHAQAFLDKPAFVPILKDASRRCLSFQSRRQKFVISKSSKQASLLPSVKATETASAVSSNNNGALSENAPQGLSQEKNVQKSTFPSGLEAFVLGVCDETDVAEVKLKVGQFEMHLRRNIGSPTPAPFVPSAAPPATPPPVPSKPKAESGPAAPQAASQKSTSAPTNPFANTSAIASKLAALEASGSNTYVLVSSPTVGLFRSGRTVKGKKQPPSCKEGDIIKEGQVIGYLDQFGSELPIKSDAAGEILKFLFKDGEPVGYGDPLVAVLPAFHGIK